MSPAKRQATTNFYHTHLSWRVLVQDAVCDGVPVPLGRREEPGAVLPHQVPLHADGVLVRPNQVDLGELRPQGPLS